MRSAEVAIAELSNARAVHTKSHREGLKLLSEIFSRGLPPEGNVSGRLRGELIALDIAPGVTQMLTTLTSRWLPWQGKTFDPASQSGDNIFIKNSLTVARIFNPFYRGFTNDGGTTYRAFAFRTYLAPGLEDPDLKVMKIDYDLAENPSVTIRRVLDELVQIGDKTYLGKAHVKWWWGSWQRVAFFALIDPS